MELLAPSFEPWDPTSAVEDRVAVLMSGGVDSSVTAHLLKEQGWDIVGITMKIPMSCNPTARSCCGADAALVCQAMGIPHYFLDVREEFKHHIIDRFRSEYENGRTPNPCADCNTFMKYALVFESVRERFNVERIASGHYARICRTPAGPVLQRALDHDKDQSYFLYGIEPDRLQNIVFPLGGLTKKEVRRIARANQLAVWDKTESMELCFCGDDYRDGLNPGKIPGPIVDTEGDVLGQHNGIANYTIGQRKGLGIATGEPVYVVDVQPAANKIVVGSRDKAEIQSVRAQLETVFLEDCLTNPASSLYAKIRSCGTPIPCRLLKLADREITVRFEKPQFAPCPGQKLVIYNEQDLVVAGGTIRDTGNAAASPSAPASAFEEL